MANSPATGAATKVELYRLLIADVYELAGLSRASSERSPGASRARPWRGGMS